MKTAPLAPSRWQMHFSTLLAVTIFAGALIGCNLQVTSSDYSVGMGWPLMYKGAYTSMEIEPGVSQRQSLSRDEVLTWDTNYYLLGFNIIFGLVLTGVLARACEYINCNDDSISRTRALRRFKR